MTNQAIRKEKAGADVTLTIRIQMLTILAAAAGEAIRYRNRFPSLLDSRVALVCGKGKTVFLSLESCTFTTVEVQLHVS